MFSHADDVEVAPKQLVLRHLFAGDTWAGPALHYNSLLNSYLETLFICPLDLCNALLRVHHSCKRRKEQLRRVFECVHILARPVLI